MLNIGIIIGSTRPGRVGNQVGAWVFEESKKRDDARFELVDLRDFDLPLLDEPVAPAMEPEYAQPHTRVWAKKIGSFDAFIFVTPEYNHGIPGALKNAIDFLYKEWNDKVAGFVAYGSAGGTRSVEQLRMVCGELQIATVRSQVALSLKTDFENYQNFKPAAYHGKVLNGVFDQVIRWGTAIRSLRVPEEVEASYSQKEEGTGASLQ